MNNSFPAIEVSFGFGIRLEGEVWGKRVPLTLLELSSGRKAVASLAGPVSPDAPIWLLYPSNVDINVLDAAKSCLTQSGYRVIVKDETLNPECQDLTQAHSVD